MPSYSFAAAGIVWKDASRKEVLLMKHWSSYPHGLMGEWFFPGGIVEYGEQPRDAARREVEEETSVVCDDLELVDVCAYLEKRMDNGKEKSVQVALVSYEGTRASGEAAFSEETEEVAWVRKEDLGKYLSPRIASTYLSLKIRRDLGLS